MSEAKRHHYIPQFIKKNFFDIFTFLKRIRTMNLIEQQMNSRWYSKMKGCKREQQCSYFVLESQVKSKSNTRVFDLGFSFTKNKALSAFFGCRRAVILSLSGFVWECSYPFIRSRCRRLYVAKGSWATERSESGRFVRNTLCFVSELEKCKFKYFTFFGQIYCVRRRQLH